ncbi:MAG: hypothetical protein LBF22_00480, partial [Deltaproteobacteria bacterium]|nr:hypothetical protein [Deltaproteobacteria bacterium]
MSIETIKDFHLNSYEYDKVDNPRYGLGRKVYFTTDNQYAISLYEPNLITDDLVLRLRYIIFYFSKLIFDRPGGDFFKNIFCWPKSLIFENNNILGTVTPVYPKKYFFEAQQSNNQSQILPGTLKDPCWYASAYNYITFVPEKEKGNLLGLLNVCLNLSRGIHKLHEFDLLPANISFNNCLIDPVSGGAIIKELTHLIIKGIPNYQQIETLEFMAPELVKNRSSKSNKIPHSKETDHHALAVLIYYLLFHRHPLLGSARYHNDEDMNMYELLGNNPIFIENPDDQSNILDLKHQNHNFLPWVDTSKTPFSVLGPYLSKLFTRSFITGL